MRIIQKHELEYSTTPPSGWYKGEFYLTSGGKGIKRVYLPNDNDIPGWAFDKPGSPARPGIVCRTCGTLNTRNLVSGKYCNKCGCVA